MTTIDNNNYELWLLRYAEGELTSAEREAVEAWLASHPEAAEELALYSEAPRLERDETVQYTAMPQQHTQRLWPILLRWSAAAAVVVALVIPALRLGTMGKPDPQQPPLVATAQSTPNIPSSQSSPSTPKETIATIDTMVTLETIKTKESKEIQRAYSPEEPILIAQQEDTLPLLPQETQEAPSAIPSTSLIVYIPAPDTVYSDNLIVYDDSRPRLRDLAAEWVEDTPVGKFIRHNLSPRKAVLIALR